MTNRGGAPEEPLAGEDAAAAEPAVLHGFLTDVNLSARTARLRDMDGGFAGLIYGAALDGSARRLEERYVTVRGSGRFGPGGDWLAVRAESFEGDRSMREPFDREAFLREPNPKIFDPAEAVVASEPFDADEFIRVIREGRDV